MPCLSIFIKRVSKAAQLVDDNCRCRHPAVHLLLSDSEFPVTHTDGRRPFVYLTSTLTVKNLRLDQAGGFTRSLSVIAITADKFTHEACGWDLVVHIRFLNIVEDLHKTPNLIVAAIFRLNGQKQGINMLFQHSQLI